MRAFLRQLRPALTVLLAATVACGVVYPLAVTAVAQLAFGRAADGSLVRRDGAIVGSSLIGQPFSGDAWFQPRPSAAGSGYDGTASSGSNLGPTNEDLLVSVAERVAAYRAANGLAPDRPVPVDAVTASGSGLDPHISVANARLQAPRIAAARGLNTAQVMEVIRRSTVRRPLGFLGDEGVAVLTANLALEQLAPIAQG